MKAELEESRKELEKRLTQLESQVSRYKNIINKSNLGIIHIGKTGKILFVNPALLKLENIPENELIGHSALSVIKRFVRPESIPSIVNVVKRALAGESIETFELEFRNKILEITARLEPKFKGVTGIIRDITLQKKHETDLEQTKTLYRSLFEDAPIMYATTINIEGQPIISDSNMVFISKLGYKREQVIGQTINNLYTDK